ncbi:MAG: tetratricopeptide repeat protein, partial [Candidatus Coatesbacteria bacterium]|nr:tetratricopeptide repeat protein [Candidatus Coatesbacteria bacterium]
SSKVKFLTAEAFDFESLGVQQFPGVSRPLEVFRVVGPRSVAGEHTRFSELGASMFGRETELGALKTAFERLRTCYPDPKPCAAGESKFRKFSHIFGITGEAGIGKSRLKRELRRHAEEVLGRDGARVLTGEAWGIGQTPLYWPIKEQIASALAFELTASSEVIGQGMSRLKNDAWQEVEHVPYIYHLFGVKDPDNPLPDLEPKSVKDNLWIAIRKLYERFSVEKPLVLVFEDVQWADGGTKDYLEYLSDFVSDFPVLILLLYRPCYEPRFARIERIPFTEMKLGPLSKGAETDLLSFYLADGEGERALIRRIRNYSEGNPLFAEEFLHLLLERGKLKLEGGKMHLAEEVEKMPLPTGLSGVLGERFDRLAREDKRIAYYGAVIGRSFLYTLLSDLHGRLHGVPKISDALNTLLFREIVFQRAVEPDLEYIFKHALTREMLVSRLVDSLRRELSRLIATRIEELYKDRLDEFHGTLSEHYEAAGDIEKAARHAGFHAIHERREQNNFDALDAFERYDRLSARVEADLRVCPEDRATILSAEEQADLLVSRIIVLHVLGRLDEAMALCDPLAGLGGGEWRAKSLNWQARIRSETGDYDAALDLANAALDLVRQTQDHREQASLLNPIGNVHHSRGDYDKAIRCFNESLTMLRDLGDKRGIADALGSIGIVQDSRGDYGEALRCYEEALAMHRELGDKRGVATVMGNIGGVHFARGDYDEALRCHKEAIAVHRELGDKRGIAMVVGNIGLIHDSRGDYDEALRCHGEALAMHRELGNKRGIAMVVGNIGLIHDSRGDYDEALRCLEEALVIHRQLGEKRGIAIVLVNTGNVHFARGDYDEALRCFEETLLMSRQIDDRPVQEAILSNIASVYAERGEWRDAREAAVQAEQLWHDTGYAEYAPQTLSVLCRCSASQADWKALSSYESEALSMSEEIGNPELSISGLLSLAKANLQVAAWYDRPRGEPPPLSRDEAIAKAADYANQAKRLAEAKGMKGWVKRANELLAEIKALGTKGA